MIRSLATDVLTLDASDNGTLLEPWEYDAAEFEPGWRYELIRGVLVVSPIPGRKERGPNDELHGLLWYYQRFHPQGAILDETMPEEVTIGNQRRRLDRAIWVGLGRSPTKDDPPTIAVEFVSAGHLVYRPAGGAGFQAGRNAVEAGACGWAVNETAGRRNRQRDYTTKRRRYRKLGVREYWIIDRFSRQMIVHRFAAGAKSATLVVAEDESYETPLLPGFLLPLVKLLAVSDRQPS